MSEQAFDVIVIGAGPAGEVAAGVLAVAGRSVAIVERELVGGECSFWACMPSKALLRPAEILAEARRVPGASEAVHADVNVAAVLRRRDEVIHDLDDASQLPWLADRGVTLIRGHARIAGERQVSVGEDLLTARTAVIIAVGSGAAMPPIPGLTEARPWTNREITTASEVPRRLLILGGGVVGVEMAQAWSSLGARVTIVEGLDRLIAGEEAVASEELARALRERGVDIHLGVRAVGASRDDGAVQLTLDDGTVLVGDEILVAAGRRPLTADLGLEHVGLEAGKTIEVDAEMRAAGRDWLYAIGDVNGRALLTHMGKYQARSVAATILGTSTPLRMDGRQSPRVIFTDPQIAAVGETEATARAAGRNIRVVDTPTSATAAGSFFGRGAAGTTRFIVDSDRNVLIGATFTGPDVAELLHAATIAIVAEVPLSVLAHAIPSFPTRSELWLRLTENIGA